MTAAIAEPTAELPTYDDPLPDMPPPPPPAPTTAAPYGLRRDGTPRAKPGVKPGTTRRGPGGRFQSTSKPAAPKKAAASKPAATQVNYAEPLAELLGGVAATVALTGLMRGDVRLIADAAAGERAIMPIAQTVNTAADQFPVVAAILDKALKVGPYSVGIAATIGLVGQVLVNHGKLPAGIVPGTVPTGQFAEAYLAEKMRADPSFAAMVNARQAPQPQPATP